jgi:hypothetical protein
MQWKQTTWIDTDDPFSISNLFIGSSSIPGTTFCLAARWPISWLIRLHPPSVWCYQNTTVMEISKRIVDEDAISSLLSNRLVRLPPPRGLRCSGMQQPWTCESDCGWGCYLILAARSLADQQHRQRFQIYCIRGHQTYGREKSRAIGKSNKRE